MTPREHDGYPPTLAHLKYGHFPGELTLAGEFDVTSASMLRTALDVAASEARDVVVDVSAVTFMDAGTVRILRTTGRAVARAGGSLKVIGVSGLPLRVMQICGAGPLIAEGERHDALSWRPAESRGPAD
jgi:anti-sigma B factor antagonist